MRCARFLCCFMALVPVLGAQCPLDVEWHSQTIESLMMTGKFDDAEPLVHKRIQEAPNNINSLELLEVLMNGQHKFHEADEVRTQIRTLWLQQCKKDWIAKGSPTEESHWWRMASQSKDYYVVGSEYFLPQIIEGDPRDRSALIGYYRILGYPTAGGRARLFLLNHAKTEKDYFLEEFSRDKITMASSYAKMPDLRVVVADVVKYLDRTTR